MNEDCFACLMCLEYKEASEILTLQCKHIFCLMCLQDYGNEHLSANIKCPHDNCSENLTDFHIRKILSEADLQRYESMMLECLALTHTCLLPDCQMIIEYEERNVQYDCYNCSLYNCIGCQEAHKSMSCQAFQLLRATDSAKAAKICDRELARARKLLLRRQSAESRESIKAACDRDLLDNDEIFECELCCLMIGKGNGLKLRSCLHLVCRPCLINYIKTTDKFPTKCPNGYCKFPIEDREIRKILSEEEFEMYTKKMLNRIKPKLVNHFQCQSPNCSFFCELTDLKKNKLKCLSCKAVNCIPCKAIHEGETCAKYKSRIGSTDMDATLKFLENQIKQGKCMKCPDCQNVLQKISGCNWIQCSNCGVELCWVLQKHRWGPKGRGDTSAGCKCMVDDVPCHPDCKGCIPHNENQEECGIM